MSDGAVAVVLAGGLSRRMGVPKALVELGGRPLLAWPLAAALDAGLEAFVVAKRGSPLPPLDARPAAVFCTYDVAPRRTLERLADALIVRGARVSVGERFRGGMLRTKRASLTKVPGFVDAALATFAAADAPAVD